MFEIVLLVDKVLLPEPVLLLAFILIIHLLRWILPLRVEHCIFNLDFYVGVVDEFVIFLFLLEIA